MKKHIIAAAVAAAVAAPAMAQNVTVSGLIDVAPHTDAKNTIGAASIKSSGTTGVSGWSTSNIAFTASEDLGGGMKASATISSFFDSGSTSPGNGLTDAAGTAYNTIGGRDRFIKLEGGFGAIQFGRFTPTINGYCGYSCAGGTNNNAGTTDSGSSDLVAGTLSGRKEFRAVASRVMASNNAYSFSVNDGNASDRDAAAVTASATNAAHMEHQSGVFEFTTPTVSGFNAVLTYINGKNDDSGVAGTDKATQHGLRVNYSAGPLAASLATGTRKGEIELDTEEAQTKVSVNWLGLSYDLGMVKLFASHANRKDKLTDTDNGVAEVTLANVKVNTIGLQVPMGAVTFNASMYEGKNKGTLSPFDEGDAAEAEDRKLKGHQISARYALSKRTFAYVVTGVNKDSRDNTALDNDDFKRSQTQIGFVHSF